MKSSASELGLILHPNVAGVSLVCGIVEGILVSNVQDTMATVDQPMVPTVLPAEYSRLTGWFPCGKKTNGRGGLGRSIVAGTLVSSVRDMMVTVAQIMDHNVLTATLS